MARPLQILAQLLIAAQLLEGLLHTTAHYLHGHQVALNPPPICLLVAAAQVEAMVVAVVAAAVFCRTPFL